MSTSASFDAYAARHAAIAALEAELLPGNKAVVLAALTRASIISVMATFDGSGDSGQIEQIDAFGVGNAIVPLPETAIVFREIMSEDFAIVSRTRSIREAIEIMAYDLLEKTHDGWEDNEGAYGEFTFSVAEGAITLDYNERHLEATNCQTVF